MGSRPVIIAGQGETLEVQARMVVLIMQTSHDSGKSKKPPCGQDGSFGQWEALLFTCS